MVAREVDAGAPGERGELVRSAIAVDDPDPLGPDGDQAVPVDGQVELPVLGPPVDPTDV